MTQSSALTVTEINGTLVVDSRLIAEQLDIQHKNFLATIDKYAPQMAESSIIKAPAFETREFKTKQGNVSTERWAWLTEPQANFVMSLSRNTDPVVKCKIQLVEAFEEAKAALKQVEPTLTAQELRIKDLELQLSVAQAQAEAAKQSRMYVELNHSIATLHGAPMLALMQGRPEAVIEQVVEVKEVVLCTESGKPIVHTKGITKTAVAKELGLKKAEKLVEWLKSMNRQDLLIDGYTAVACQYVPYESLKEIKQLWASHKGERQQILGE